MRQLLSFFKNQPAVQNDNRVKLSDILRHDDITAQCSLNGQPCALKFSPAGALLKAQQWQAQNGVVSYTFAPNTYGYLVEVGNHTNFAEKQPTASLDVSAFYGLKISARITQAANVGGQYKLFFIISDAARNVLGKHNVALENGQGDLQFSLPKGAHYLYFALRLEGQGVFSGIHIDVQSDPVDMPKPKMPANQSATPIQDAMSAGHTKPIDIVNSLIKERNFARAITYLQTHFQPHHGGYSSILSCYASVCDFEGVVRAYESLPETVQRQYTPMRHYLVALGNLQRSDDVREFLMSRYYGMNGNTALPALALLHSFAVMLGEDMLANNYLACIVERAQEGQKTPNILISAAHYALENNDQAAFHRLHYALATAQLKSYERASKHMLMAHHAFLNGHENAMVECINQSLATAGVAPIALHQGTQGQTLFTRLSSPSCMPSSVRGPLVSVLMTCYNASDYIDMALRSIMNQTYADIEILISDDCSTDDSLAKIQALAAQDSRIKVLPMRKNGGTYVAKNHGLAIAQGKYVTCHDSDDWAHPQKIEFLVRKMETSAEDIIATAIKRVRFCDSKGFRGRGGYVIFDAPSLLYRRAEVLEHMGFYDCVRAGADTEFQYRMERIFGRDSITVQNAMLTFGLWADSTLTGGGDFAIDDDTGVFAPARAEYRRHQCHWHEHAQTLYLPFPAPQRPFYAPSSALPDRG